MLAEPNQLTLDKLPRGQQATIIRIGGERSLRRRLLEMGLINGELLTLTSVAPLGDPIELMIKGYRLSVRKDEAQYIVVELYSEKSQEA